MKDAEALGCFFIINIWLIDDFEYGFNGNKIITSGGGGAILCKKKTNLIFKHISTHAKVRKNDHLHDKIGFNYRDQFINCVGCAQLEKLKNY